ncbi:MAG: hypothetical protein WCG80_19250 [Spirochaetales bacterium]
MKTFDLKRRSAFFVGLLVRYSKALLLALGPILLLALVYLAVFVIWQDKGWWAFLVQFLKLQVLSGWVPRTILTVLLLIPAFLFAAAAVKAYLVTLRDPQLAELEVAELRRRASKRGL